MQSGVRHRKGVLNPVLQVVGAPDEGPIYAYVDIAQVLSVHHLPNVVGTLFEDNTAVGTALLERAQYLRSVVYCCLCAGQCASSRSHGAATRIDARP